MGNPQNDDISRVNISDHQSDVSLSEISTREMSSFCGFPTRNTTSHELRFHTTKVMLAGLKSQLERCHHFGDFPTVIRHLMSRESRQLKRTCVLFKLSPNVLSLCNVFEVHMAKYILKHHDQFILLTFISKRHYTKQDLQNDINRQDQFLL